MNKLPEHKRNQVLHMLVEGSSMRSISRVVGVSMNTIVKLLQDAGEAALEYHHTHVRELNTKRVECDEIWSFCYSKGKNAKRVTGDPEYAGDVWTWTALDSDSKLLIAWLVSTGRDSDFAIELMDDVRSRLTNRVQLTTDGHRAYIEAVEGAFGGDVDYAQLVKLYGTPPVEEQRRYSPSHCIGTRKQSVTGKPNEDYICTAYVERHNLTIRMSVRRFTRLTNAFSKKMQNHCYAAALYALWYNFCKGHKTLNGGTPAMDAGLAVEPYSIAWIGQLIDARAPKPGPRGPYGPRKSVNSN